MGSGNKKVFLAKILLFAACQLPLAIALGGDSSWTIGPFIRPEGLNPVIGPDPASEFLCPVSGKPVHWEALHTFNPAAVTDGERVYVIYRAEDSSGTMKVGGHTSRLGLAVSSDGLHFDRTHTPVLFPANDRQKHREWKGGCEDPRLVRTEEGSYLLYYTQYNKVLPRLAVATSSDLRHWTKRGPAFSRLPWWLLWPTKSGAVICRSVNGMLQAIKIRGRYWMYFGVLKLHLASSKDLVHWYPRKVVFRPRPGKYDSHLTEAGPPAVLTDRGVVLLYNGENAGKTGDPGIQGGTYTVGQLLFDPKDPGKCIGATGRPCFAPEESFEKTGQYAAGTTFAEGLVLFKGKWFLYYGCADSFVGVAVAKEK